MDGVAYQLNQQACVDSHKVHVLLTESTMSAANRTKLV